MRFIARGVAIGLLTGAALFFFPFLFRFLFFILLVSFIIRLARGRGWHNRRRRFGYYRNQFRDRDDVYSNNTISIDGRGFVPPIRDNGNERSFPVL